MEYDERDRERLLGELEESKKKIASLEERLIKSEDLSKYEHIEKKAAGTEKFLNSIINTIQDILYVFKPSGQFVIWNKALKEVTEYTDEEISKMKSTDFFPKAEVAKVAAAIAVVFVKGRNTVNSVILTKSGKSIPYSLSGSMLKGPGGELLLCGIGKDIRHLEEARANLNEKIYSLEVFNKASVGRELKMVELKNKIEKLEKILAKKERR